MSMPSRLAAAMLALLLGGATPTWGAEPKAEHPTEETASAREDRPAQVERGRQRRRAPWVDPEVLRAAAAIGMTAEQTQVFRNATGAFVDGLGRERRRLMKRGQPGIARKMRRATDRLAGEMDAAMRAALNDEQYPRYEAYRDLLLLKIADMGNRRGRRGR